MNFRIVTYTIGQILKVLAAFLVIPLIVSVCCGEIGGGFALQGLLAFMVPILFCLSLGFILTCKRPKETTYYAKEGLLIVGFSWVVMSLIGAIPFSIGTYGNPNFADLTYFDWLFESVSGFTTTGASILHNVADTTISQIDIMSGVSVLGAGTHYYALLLWRSLTHWIGGMGMLIFILAILPSSSNGASSIHLMQAESTGQSVGKLVSRVNRTARILYLIYAGMTVLLFLLLLLGMVIPSDGARTIDPFNAVIFALSTAGTGGFAAVSTSAAEFGLYVQIMLIVFMFLFGVNFNMYFLLFTRKFKDILRSEELRFYFFFLIAVIFVMTLNVCLSNVFEAIYANNFGAALKDTVFSAVACMTSTGFSVAGSIGGMGDFTVWPTFSIMMLFMLMFVGACAGSTGGGFKCSRFLVLAKSMWISCKRIINPNAVYVVRLNGKRVDEEVTHGVLGYFIIYLIILVLVTLILSFDPFVSAQGGGSFLTALSSSLTCLNNIGPGLTSVVGPAGNFFGYTIGMKIVMSVEMLIGRLEIFPIVMLFNPKTYSRQ